MNLQVYHYANNNPISYTDPTGEVYFKVGYTETGSMGAGATVSTGIAIGYSKEKGIEVGRYTTYGSTLSSDVGTSFGLEIGLGTKNVSDMDGVSISLGGSGGEGLVGGGDISISADGSQVEISGNVGAGLSLLPAEGHINTTITETTLVNDKVNNFFTELEDRVKTGAIFGIPSFLSPVQ